MWTSATYGSRSSETESTRPVADVDTPAVRVLHGHLNLGTVNWRPRSVIGPAPESVPVHPARMVVRVIVNVHVHVHVDVNGGILPG